jgi:hypothetical protein
MSRIICTVTIISMLTSLGVSRAQEDSDESKDTSAGLPKEYADYLIGSKTVSPDKKFAVIYPKIEVCTEDEPKKGSENRCKDYLVALKPFQILTVLETDSPEFQRKNHGGMSAAWSKDGSAVLVTLDSKWGPGDIFLYEISGGKVTRSTDLLKKVHDLMAPDYKKAMAEPISDTNDFIFEPADEEGSPVADFADATHVRVRAMATTDPKEIPGLKAWDAAVQATWDIPQAKFTSQKVTRKFAGVRKESD